MKPKDRGKLGTTRIEPRLAPPKYTERRRGKPGSGHKRPRAAMAPRPNR
jgi:hypothetical protein